MMSVVSLTSMTGMTGMVRTPDKVRIRPIES